jgi:WD40 repeat protein
LDEILHVLMPDTALDIVPKLERQIKQLLEQMRKRRCLIILDNGESILAEGEQSGDYRPGYAGYGELLRRVGESTHLSCLLLTSREKPGELTLLEAADSPVRVLNLSSLIPEDSRTLLMQKGLFGEDNSWQLLNGWYSGNPLVLQVVGDTIRELFQGKIDSFLRYEQPIFGTIRDLLARQFARLTPLERSVLIWLAIHRRPVDPGTLRQEMEPAPNGSALLDALYSLRRRSLVESGEAGFTLQNVVLEFVTDYLVEQVVQEVVTRNPLLLQTHALFQTQAPQYIRDSQTRLLLQPVVDQLVARLGRAGAENAFAALRTSLRQDQTHRSGYGAGNLLNLLVKLNGHLRGQDFSGMTLRQATLQGIEAQGATLSGAHLDNCEFTIAFQAIISLALSPTGDYLAIGGGSGLHYMQRIHDGYSLYRHLYTGSTLWTVCFSADGTMLAAGGTDCVVHIWEGRSGTCLHTLRGHTGSIWAVSFSPDGRRVASGSADSAIRIWDLPSGQCLSTIQGHTKGVRSLCFSPDGEQLVSAGEDGAVRIWQNWDAPDGARCVQILDEHTDMVWAAAFSPDGAILATAGHDRTIRLWETQTYRPIANMSGHTHYITRLCFNADGSRLASCSYDGTIRLWDTTTAQCLSTLQGNHGRLWGLAFCGNIIASGGSDRQVRLWDVDPALGGGQCVKTLYGYTNSIRSVAFSPDGTLVASAGQDRLVRLWDRHTGECLHTLTGHTGTLWHVRFSPDGRLLASSGHDRTIQIWDVATGHSVHEIVQEEGCDAVSFHPTLPLMATANLDHTITLWNTESRQVLSTLYGHTGEVWAVAFHPEGQWLASGSIDGEVCLWDWRSGQRLHTLLGHISYIRAVAFSPDGKFLASTSYDSTIRLWDSSNLDDWSPAEQLYPIQVLPCPEDMAQLHVAFSPDGRWLASASVNGVVYLWRMADALRGHPPTHALKGHKDKAYSVDFCRNGFLLASGGEDGAIRLWDVSDPERGVACVQILQIEKLYAHMDITGATGLTQAQILSLQTLGAKMEGARAYR